MPVLQYQSVERSRYLSRPGSPCLSQPVLRYPWVERSMQEFRHPAVSRLASVYLLADRKAERSRCPWQLAWMCRMARGFLYQLAFEQDPERWEQAYRLESQWLSV